MKKTFQMSITGYFLDAFFSLPLWQHTVKPLCAAAQRLIDTTCCWSIYLPVVHINVLLISTIFSPAFSLLLLLLWAFLHRVDLIIYRHDLFSFAQHKTGNLHPAVSNFLSLPQYISPSIFSSSVSPKSAPLSFFLLLQRGLIFAGLSANISVFWK